MWQLFIARAGEAVLLVAVTSAQSPVAERNGDRVDLPLPGGLSRPASIQTFARKTVDRFGRQGTGVSAQGPVRGPAYP